MLFWSGLYSVLYYLHLARAWGPWGRGRYSERRAAESSCGARLQQKAHGSLAPCHSATLTHSHTHTRHDWNWNWNWNTVAADWSTEIRLFSLSS